LFSSFSFFVATNVRVVTYRQHQPMLYVPLFTTGY